MLLYLVAIHSPNLHQLFILTWSTDTGTTWWFASLTFISRLSDHGKEEIVKSILQYLLVLHSPNLHQLFLLKWSTDTTWWFVSLAYVSRFSDHGSEEIVKSIIQYLKGSKLTLVRWPVASGFPVGPVESVLHWPGWQVKFKNPTS